MTLANIKADLFQFFATHDTFSLDENFDELSELNILIPKAEKPLARAMIEKALESYEAEHVVAKLDNIDGEIGKKIWVLEKPLEQYSQNIELSYPTLLGMTRLINDYCEQIKNEEAKVDPLNITERDVNSLLLITHQVLNIKEDVQSQ